MRRSGVRSTLVSSNRQKEKEFVRELASGYVANAELNRALAREFAEIDNEKWNQPKHKLKLDPPLIRPAGRRIDLTNDQIHELIDLP